MRAYGVAVLTNIDPEPHECFLGPVVEPDRKEESLKGALEEFMEMYATRPEDENLTACFVTVSSLGEVKMVVPYTQSQIEETGERIMNGSQ